MKQRILNKKLKRDALIQLWINHIHNTLDNLQDIMMTMTSTNYKDHKSLWYCRFKICGQLLNEETDNLLTIGAKRYNVSRERIYKYYFPIKCHISYNQYKKLHYDD